MTYAYRDRDGTITLFASDRDQAPPREFKRCDLGRYLEAWREKNAREWLQVRARLIDQAGERRKRQPPSRPRRTAKAKQQP